MRRTAGTTQHSLGKTCTSPACTWGMRSCSTLAILITFQVQKCGDCWLVVTAVMHGMDGEGVESAAGLSNMAVVSSHMVLPAHHTELTHADGAT